MSTSSPSSAGISAGTSDAGGAAAASSAAYNSSFNTSFNNAYLSNHGGRTHFVDEDEQLEEQTFEDVPS